MMLHAGSPAPASLDFFAIASHGMAFTHLDALCHVFWQGKMYNGFSSSEIGRWGAGKCAIDVAEKAEGVHVEEGDVLLLRIGRHTRKKLKGPWDPRREGLAGLDASCLPWLYERRMAVQGCDVSTSPYGS